MSKRSEETLPLGRSVTDKHLRCTGQQKANGRAQAAPSVLLVA